MSGGAIMCWPASALPEIQHPNSTLTLTITEGILLFVLTLK